MTAPALRLPRARHVPAIVPVAAGGVLFLGAWRLIVAFGDFQPWILPAPEVVAARFVRAWADGTIEPHVAATLVEIVAGFAVGSLAALAVGYLLARSRLAGLVLSPYLVAAQSTPVLALSPLIALWFGSGIQTAIIICALIVFFPVAVATMVGIRTVDRGLLELARSLRASPRDVLLTLELPAALPQILGGIRVGVTLAVVGAIIGEWTGGERGLGVLVNLARGSLFDTPLLFATLLTIALIGSALYGLVVLVERRLIRDRP